MKSNALIGRIFAGLCLFILILPLVNLPPWFSPPEWGKSIAFRAFFSSVLLLLAFLLLGESRLRILESIRQKVSLAKVGVLCLGGLALAFFLASLFSPDPNFSFWGNPVRAGGSVTFLWLIASCFFAFVFFSKTHWKYAWHAFFITAALVALAAIFQWRGWLPSFFVSRETRPGSTLGNDIQLGIFLIIFLFPVLVFFLKEKIGIKRILYALGFLLFLFVILLTGSRGAYLGMFLGFSYFVLFYPLKKLAHSLALKFLFLLVMLIPAFAVYYANTHEVFPDVIQKNTTLYAIAGRLQLKQFITEEPRFSTWKVGWEAIKARPVFGYGPENFEIGFDRHYDPKFPNIQYEPRSPNSWWDRGHNVLVDTGVQAGIPGLLFYLGFLGFLFWQLQRIKQGDATLLSHGLQAALVAYLGALLFGFDNFSTMLAFFFLAAYILHITSKEPETQTEQMPAPSLKNSIKIPAMVIVGILLLAFNWFYGLKPFLVNANVQTAKAAVERGLCKPAYSQMEKALGKGSTFLDAYVKTTYFDALRNCQSTASETLEIAKKSRVLLKEAAEAWPYHTRTWVFLGQITTIIADRDQLTSEEKQTVIQEAQSYYERAKELSPKHQEIYLSWAKLLLVAEDYEGMLEKAQTCIDIYPETGECWFLKGLALKFQGNDRELRNHVVIARSLGYDPDKDISALNNLVKAYVKFKELGPLAQTYEKIVTLRPEPQFYASLAFTYAQLGEFAKARQAALKVLELDPSTKAEVEEFLRTLP